MIYRALFRPANTLSLPLSVTKIDTEAFSGTNIQAVEIAHGCSSICARAFANCSDLAWIRIPESVIDIADDAFSGDDDLIIISPYNSAAQKYAYKNGFMWLDSSN